MCIRDRAGEYIFYDKDGYAMLSQTALYFIGGLLTHIRSHCGFTNPSTNSYKRLVPGCEAPVTSGFAMANRSAAIRIPAYAKEPSKKRFELRNPDATCNPYYAYSAILMAGLDGIRRKLDPKDHNWGQMCIRDSYSPWWGIRRQSIRPPSSRRRRPGWSRWQR